MNKSIENVWKEGFAHENLVIPRVNKLYNRKSISVVEKVINRFKTEVYLLIPLAIGFFVFNLFMDNENAIFWGIVSALPSFVWLFLGIKQVKSIEAIDYKMNSYEYLISIKKRLEQVSRFNRNLGVSSIPIILTPMLVYTYNNQQGKSIGDIFGVERFNFPAATMFLLIPIFTLLALLLSEVFFKRSFAKKTSGIDSLINEMEELRE